MDTERLKKLYADSFSDSKGYLDFYFSKRFNGNNVEYFGENGDSELPCELFYFDRKIKLFNNVLNGSFISGACTDERFQKKGYMTRLLNKTLNNMYIRGMDIAYLYPFLHEFYEKYSFATFSFMRKVKYCCERVSAKREQMGVALDLYNAYVKKYNLYTLRTLDDFYEIFDGIKADFGEFYFLKYDGMIVGYNYVDSFKEQNEFVCLNCNIISDSGYDCLLPSQSGDGEKYSMIRIINVLKTLEKCSVKKDISFSVSDDIIMQNNIDLAFFKGKLVKVSNGEIKISILDLARECFCSVDKYAVFEDKININFEKY